MPILALAIQDRKKPLDRETNVSANVEYRLASIYWRWVDSWMVACPPFRGFRWKGGQESAVRLTAILLGFSAMGDEGHTGPARFVQMVRLAWATGYRIFHHINYALSQKNNHAGLKTCS